MGKGKKKAGTKENTAEKKVSPLPTVALLLLLTVLVAAVLGGLESVKAMLNSP